MKKFALLTVSILMLLTLAGCASTAAADAAEVPAEEAVVVEEPVKAPEVYGKYGIPMPDWVAYGKADDENTLYATATAKMSTSQNSRTRALAEARATFAMRIQTIVEGIIVTYTNDAGDQYTRQAVDAMETVMKNKVNTIVSGVKEEAFWEDENGEVYVLVSMPRENLKYELIEATNEVFEAPEFEKNDAAVESNRMMQEAIQKYFGSAN